MNVIRFVLAALAAAVALVATLPVVLVGLPFWAVAGLARGTGSLLRRWQPREVAWNELIEFVPQIGWKNRPGARVRVRAKRSFQVTTDAEGWRGGGSIDTSDVIVFGDSFAFGHGIDDRGFFAHRVPGVRVKAVGVDGYNMVQQLLWMERLQPRLAGKLVVWFAFYGNDLMDNLRPNFQHYRTPFLRSSGNGSGEPGWEIATGHVSAEPWPFDPDWGYRNKIATICTPSYHSERAYEACAALIDRAAALCAAVGARLAVVGIPDVLMLDPVGQRALKLRSPDPDAFDPGLPDRRIAHICATREVPFVALSEVLTVDDHLPDDCHWTARGHAHVAREIGKLHRDLAPPPPTPAGEGAAVRRSTGAPVYVLGQSARS
jgi:hypothetical protein